MGRSNKFNGSYQFKQIKIGNGNLPVNEFDDIMDSRIEMRRLLGFESESIDNITIKDGEITKVDLNPSEKVMEELLEKVTDERN